MRKRDYYVRRKPIGKVTGIICVCFLMLMPLATVAQHYGLQFRSHESAADARTGLELANEDICFRKNAEVSINLRFREKGKGYYGYIWRMYTSQGLNIDLVFKPSSPRFKFNLVVGKQASGLSFEVDSLYDWNEIRLVLNADENEIRLITPDTVLRKTNAGLAGDECIRIALGRSHIAGIRAIDLPPMSVKDIRIAVDGKARHYWPLNESTGTLAHDVLSGAQATVINPKWIRHDYQRWQLYQRAVFSGPVSLGFNREGESVLILSNDSLRVIPIGEGQRLSIPVDGDSSLVNLGDQAVYAAWRHELININLEKKLISAYDFEDRTWEKRYSIDNFLTPFLHHNKVVNPEDSSLITIGGYGQLRYKNLVQRYSFNTASWDTLTFTGDFIAPRYLFAVSAPRNGVSYLMGGYGSTTGDQMLYPEHYQDLYRVNWRELRVEKMYELSHDWDPYVFASSIVVENDSTYYGLIFPRFRSNSFLQLINGSLNRPEYEMIGDSIPFDFHDVSSFADLFLAKRASKLVAVTSFFDNSRNTTQVEIHTITFPPEKNSEIVISAMTSVSSGRLRLILIGSAFFFILMAGGMVWLRFRSRSKAALANGFRAGTVEDVTRPLESPARPQPLGQSEIRGKAPNPAAIRAARIRVFGGFSVRDIHEQDLTAKFTPLLKELFLLIALNTLRFEKGVSASKLDELFWFDKSAKSARNNRSVNIAKLKAALSEVGAIELCKYADKWKISYDPSKMHIDYADYLTLIRQKGLLSKDQVQQLISVVGNGSLLSEVQYEWLDYFKSVTGTEIIDALCDYIKTIGNDQGFEHQVEVANLMSVFDPVNEQAMHMQCKALSRMGNHTLAKNAYEKFCKEYCALYAETYKLTFQQILEGRIPVYRQT